MAISLPDALPPQQITMQVPDGATNAVLAFRSYRIHVLGPLAGSQNDLQALIEDAEDLSAATRRLSAHYIEAGYPAAQLRYMLTDRDLFLLVGLGQIVEVDSPEPIRKYFAGLTEHDPVRDTDLEHARVLASIHADRAGLNLGTELVPVEGGSRLEFFELEENIRPTQWRAQMGNPGNRFTGRHFLDLGVRHGFASGDELMLGWQTSLSGLNSDRRSDDYNDFLAGWSRVTTAGLFGINGRASVYDYPVARLFSDDTAEGRIVQVDASWLYPLSAGEDHRWIVSAKVDYTHKRAELQDGTRLQDEEYPSVEGGMSYAWLTDLGNDPATLEFEAQVRQGLGSDDDSALSATDLRYLLIRPRVLAGISPSDDWELQAEAQLQFTDDAVPEQAQWVLGGMDNLSAYLPGVLVGDSGGLVRLQASYFGIGRWAGIEMIPGAFVEYGYARFETTPPGAPPERTAEIADAGAQVEFKYDRWLRARLVAARGFADSGIDEQLLEATEANFFFTVTATF